MDLKKTLTYVGAVVLGAGLMFLLFPSAPDPIGGDDQASAGGDEGGDEGDKPNKKKKRHGRGKNKRAGHEPQRKSRSEPAVVTRGGERDPDFEPGAARDPAVAEFRASPMGRHASIDGGKWTHIAQILGQEGQEDLSKEAREMGRLVHRAIRPAAGQDPDAMLEQERALAAKIRQSEGGASVEPDLQAIEAAISAVEQGAPHPADAAAGQVPGGAPPPPPGDDLPPPEEP